MRLRLARRASRDLEAIHLAGIERFGSDQANRYLDGIWDKLSFLTENPLIAREREEIDPPIRAHPHGSHLLVYVTDGDELLVLRVAHGREDWRLNL